MTIKFYASTVTQSGADTYTVGEISTGLANVNIGARVRMIEFYMPPLAEVDSSVVLQLCRRLPTAILTVSDRRLLAQESTIVRLTTSGLVAEPTVRRILLPRDMEYLIVEDPIYFAVASGTTAIANVAGVRIFYEEMRLTDLQKVSALAESANA